MAWQQLHLATDPRHADAFQAALEALGAAAVTLTDGADQPVFEPPPGTRPLWDTTVATALFEDAVDLDTVLAALGERGLRFADHRVEALADQAWERAWMDDFQPMRFGERLWIVPSWSDAPEPGAVNLKLDPGLAFGTGSHDTTALCLEWLDGADLRGRRVLDFGCGSGVLAIAALLLGADSAVATDIDPQALTASADNASANGVGERLTVCAPEVLADQDQYDLLVANILAAPLIGLATTLAGLCRSGAPMALSGILADQAPAVRAAYAPWFELSPTRQRGDWVRIDGVRRPEADI